MEHELIHISNRNAVNLFETTITLRQSHFHQEQELFLVLFGEVTVFVNSELYTLHKGDMMLIGKNQIHMLKSTQKNLLLAAQFNIDQLNCHFPQIEEFQKLNTVIQASATDPLWQTLNRNMLRIAAYQSSNSEFSQLISMNSLMTMILAISRSLKLKESSEPKGEPIPKITSERQDRLLKWINENYTQNITLKQFADSEGLNIYYLSHYIKESLGFTFTQYLTELRTVHAVHLLESTNMKILDILIDSGFSDYRYMRKAFSERFHCTPKEYRERFKNNLFPGADDDNAIIVPQMQRFVASITEYCPDFPSSFLLD